MKRYVWMLTAVFSFAAIAADYSLPDAQATIPATDDAVLVGNGTLWQIKGVPNCPNDGAHALVYDNTTNTVSCAAISTGGGAPATASFLTTTNETATLANSRQEIAGTNITFDDSVAGVRTINASGGGGGSPGGSNCELQFKSGSSFLGAHGTGGTYIYYDNCSNTGTVNNLVFSGGGIRGFDGVAAGTAGAIGVHGGDGCQTGSTCTGRGGNLEIRGGFGGNASTGTTGGDLRIGPGAGGGGANGGPGDFQLINATMTGSATANFSATNKPGSNAGVALWWRVVVCNPSCNAYYTPLFAQ